jgi:aspartyl protease family protein
VSLPFGLHSQYLLIALAAFLLLLAVRRIPYVGAIARLAFTFALVALMIVLVTERASIDPYLGQLAGRFEADRQQVVGNELHIPMAPDGHFWAVVRINGVRRRMLIDSGATVTAVSGATAAAAGLDRDADLMPVVVTTANGTVQARTATVASLRLGDVSARNLKVLVSPAFGGMEVLGMNFLSRLKSWRVEGRTLVMVPHHPQQKPDEAALSE